MDTACGNGFQEAVQTCPTPVFMGSGLGPAGRPGMTLNVPRYPAATGCATGAPSARISASHGPGKRPRPVLSRVKMW